MYSYARRNSTARKNRQNQHYKEHTTKLQCSHTQIHHKNHHFRNGTIRSIQSIALAVVCGTVVPASAIVSSIRFDLCLFTTDENMKHICNVIGINATSLDRMVVYGICTLSDLFQTREKIKTEAFNRLRTDIKKNLLLTIKWLETNRNADIVRDFDDQAFENIFIEYGGIYWRDI